MKVSFPWCLVTILALLSMGIPGNAQESAHSYNLIHSYPLQGEGGWDSITFDSSQRLLYLAHSPRVSVVNADTGALVGEIDGLNLAHGVALVKELDRGFISDGAGNQVVIFAISNLKVLGKVQTGINPDCILYDPASKRIFTFNGGTHDSTVIDPSNGKVVATVPIGGRPEYAVADGKGMIYFNVGDANEVAALDSRSLTIQARWPIAPAAMPTALTMDREHRLLFIGGRNKILAIMDADNGKIVQTFPIGFGVDTNIYEADKRLEFTSTREGTIHIFHEDSPDKFSVVEVVKTQPGAHTMALDPKTERLFLDTADFRPGKTPNTGVFDHPAGGFHSMGIAVPGTFRLLVYGME